MSFDLPAFEQKKLLHSLLLTMDQEVEARKEDTNEYGEMPYFVKRFADGDRKIALLGTKHSSRYEDIERDVAVYKKTDPEIVLHEGNDIRDVFQDIFPGMTEDAIRELDPALVAKNQEQIFLAWQAWKDGKIVQSWDLPFDQQLEVVAKHHTPEAIAGFLVSIALSKLYENGTSPTYDAMEAMLARVLSLKSRDALSQQVLGQRLPSIDATIEKYFQTTLASLADRFANETLRREDNGMFHGRFDPAYPGETNAVLRDMNVIRDRRAIDVIQEVKTLYKNILVVAGGSHVRTWGPAVAELYK